MGDGLINDVIGRAALTALPTPATQRKEHE